MKLAEGQVLDDALELFHSHAWVVQKPELSAVQLAELIPVLAPLFQESRSKVQQRSKSKANRKPAGTVTSTEVPRRIREAVLARDEWACAYCGIAIDSLSYSLHHRRPRGMGGSRRLHTMANLVTLCGSGVDGCHGVVERDRPTSRRTGWLVPNGRTPERWRVQRRTPDGEIGWWQPGDKWLGPYSKQVADDESQGVA